MYLRRVCILYTEEYTKKCGKLIAVCGKRYHVAWFVPVGADGMRRHPDDKCVDLEAFQPVSRAPSHTQQHGLLERTNVRVSPHMKDRLKGIYAHVEAYKEGIRRKCAHMLILRMTLS